MSKYFKQSSTVEYVDDYAEIQALKYENARHSVLGFMLGDYDESGCYVVHPEIIKELIAMPKYIVETIDNFEICKSALKLDKQITFLITYEGERVTLSLMENVNFEANSKVNIGSWSNINEFVLDEVFVSGEVNRNAIYNKWNISEFGGSVLDVMNCDPQLLSAYLGIVDRFKFVIYQNINLTDKEEELEEIEEEYFLNVFAILEDYPELKKLVVKELKQNLEEKKDFIQLDKPNFARSLNEVLNKTIENNISVLKEEKQEEFKKIQHNALVRCNIQRQEVVQCVVKKPSLFEEVKENKKVQDVVVFETDDSYKRKTVTDLAQELAEKRKLSEERARKSVVETLFPEVSKVETAKQDQPVETKVEKTKTKARKTLEKVIAVITTDVNHNLEKNVSPKTEQEIKKVKEERKKQPEKTIDAQTGATTAPKTATTTPAKTAQKTGDKKSATTKTSKATTKTTATKKQTGGQSGGTNKDEKNKKLVKGATDRSQQQKTDENSKAKVVYGPKKVADERTTTPPQTQQRNPKTPKPSPEGDLIPRETKKEKVFGVDNVNADVKVSPAGKKRIITTTVNPDLSPRKPVSTPEREIPKSTDDNLFGL